VVVITGTTLRNPRAPKTSGELNFTAYSPGGNEGGRVQVREESVEKVRAWEGKAGKATFTAAEVSVQVGEDTLHKPLPSATSSIPPVSSAHRPAAEELDADPKTQGNTTTEVSRVI